jgi:hypothetical protein
MPTTETGDSVADFETNILCLASYFKGVDFLRECRARGANVYLITREKFLSEDWPRDCLTELVPVIDDADLDVFTYAAAEVAKRVRIDRVVALEEFDVINAGHIREHLRIPGMTASEARLFRDKLTMCDRASAAGIRVPEFLRVTNRAEIADYLKRVPGPWVLKPRLDVSAIGIKKLATAEEVWAAIDELERRPSLRERPSYFLLEQFIPGDVYHVDSLVYGGEPVFAGVNQYGRPPMDVAHGGGVFLTHTLDHDEPHRAALLEANRTLISALGMERGVTHAEFIKSETDGEFYFLEIACRVGGAYIAETLEAASGINLWREWAKIEIATDTVPYELPPIRDEFGGICLSLSRQEFPDTAAYDDDEIVYRVRKAFHVGLVVRSPKLDRVRELMDQYARRFADDFVAIAPPRERAE